MDINAAIEEYLASRKNAITHKTYEWYCIHLTRFGKFCDKINLTELSKVNATHVQAALEDWNAKSGNSRKVYVQVVKGFLSWCSKDEDMGVRERVVKCIEMPKVEQPEVEIFTDVEIMKLFRACEKTRQPKRNRAILHMLLDTGIRASELCVDGSRP